MTRIISLLIIAVVVAGCNSTPKKDSKPASNVVAGKNISKREFPSVRGYEIVKTYHLGRRIDPANPNIMYEAGKMYVIRRSPSWNLQPNTPVNDPAFKKRLRKFNFKLANMKKQQDLVAKRNETTGKIGMELLEVRKTLQNTSANQFDKASLSNIKQIQESQGDVKRKMAELE